MMNDGTFSAPVDLATSQIYQQDLSAASTRRAQVRPQKPTGLLIRQFIEEHPEYLTQIIRQQSDFAGEQAECFILLCGAGYDILVLVNDTPWPVDLNVIPKINLLLSLTTRTLDISADIILHQYGSIDPTDELWMHMMLAVRSGVFPGRFRIYLTAQSDGSAFREAQSEERVVLRARMEKNGRIFKVSRGYPQNDTTGTMFPVLNREINTRTSRPERKRAAAPSTVLPQKKIPKVATMRDKVPQSMVDNTEGATIATLKKGAKKNVLGQNEKGEKVPLESKMSSQKVNASPANLYGFNLEEFQALQSAYENYVRSPNKEQETSKVPARNSYGFSLDEIKLLEVAYEAVMMQPDPPQAKIAMQTPKMDSVAIVAPIKVAKGLRMGKGLGASVPTAKVNGNAKQPVQNLYGFSTDEMKMLEEAYESATIKPAKPDINVPSPKPEAFIKQQTKKPLGSVKHKAPSDLPETTEVGENQKRCFYFPFCTKLSTECGGKQRGRCREVKSGNVVLPKDDQEFLNLKKKALRSLNTQKKKKKEEDTRIV